MKIKEQKIFTETRELIYEALKKASKLDLEVEVITSIIIYIQYNPRVGIEEALEYGLKEWDI